MRSAKVQLACYSAFLLWCSLCVVPFDVPPSDQTPEKTQELSPYFETIPGTNIKFEMVPISGGTFLMGSSEDEPGHSPDESPQHQVTIRSFWMGRFEVTWDEFDQFAFKQQIINERVLRGPQQKGVSDALTRPT